jgi:hypothetical protein
MSATAEGKTGRAVRALVRTRPTLEGYAMHVGCKEAEA